jgi:outer membrane protein W
MIRRITSLAFGIAIACFGTSAFAQDEGGEEAAADAPAGDAPAGDAAGGGEAASGGAAVSSDAPPDAGGKIKLGLRLGYSIPMGDASKDNKLSDAVSGVIPIWLDLGYMVTPNIMVGLYGMYGITMLNSDIKDACDDCSASQMRFGLQGQYHISPGESLDPWVGLGIGYEIMNFKAPNPLGSGTVESDFKGFEFLNIQGGADFKVADSFAVGPFLSFSLGQYSKAGDQDIEETAMHQWFTLGVKGTLGL